MPCIVIPNEGPLVFRDDDIEIEITGALSLGYAVQLLRKALNAPDPEMDGKALKG